MRAIVVAAALLLCFAQGANAQYTVSERTGKKLTAVQEHLSAEQYAEARQILDGLNTDRMSDYERAIVHQFRGFVASGTDDYPGALIEFEKALASEALPPATQLQLRFNVAQLYMAQEEWKKALSNLEVWFRETEDPNAVAYYMLAVAYYQDEQKQKALENGKRALELEADPKESWLSLVLALHLERSEYRAALPLLEHLVERFPKKTYWMQLSALYSELGEDEKSLAVQQLAYSQGLLDGEDEILRLARLYQFHDLPYRAARVMESALEAGTVTADAESLELLGQSLMAAREFDRALDPMTRAAALSEDGDLWLRLGQIRMEREEWKEAATALEKAIEKGDLDRPGNAHLLLGISAYHQKKFDTARGAFREAAGHEDVRSNAEQWMRHLERASSS